ncbi:hypothetical protein A6R68_13282, partial [Neotoma lepida]
MAANSALPTEDGQVSLGIDDLHFSLQAYSAFYTMPLGPHNLIHRKVEPRDQDLNVAGLASLESCSILLDELMLLHAEQEDTQKKTFTCWINSQLAKHTPPSVVSDLFADIKKGHVLLDLLEVLSGQQLPRDKGSNTFQCRINIEHALTFLKNRSIKLINIHVADIVEGNPSIILGLIWTIILHFHIEELARNLSCDYNQPSPEVTSVANSSPTSSPPSKKCSKAQAQARWQLSAKKALLQWAQEQCAMSESVSVTDFKSSWRNGMAFLAVIHALRPDLIDMDSVRHRSNKENLKEAFRIAEHELQIPKLLEPEAQFLKYSKDAPGAGASAQAKAKDAMVWLTLQEKKLQKMQKDSANEAYFNKYQSLLSFMESLNEEKEPFVDVLSLKGNMNELNEDQLRLRQGWAGLTHQSLMGSSDHHLNILLAFENRDENHLPVVPPDKLKEMKRRSIFTPKAVGKQEVEDGESTRQLKVNEEVEKLIKEMRIWESESKSIFDRLRHQDGVDGSSEDTLQ